jgi:hypothetical protein
MRFVYPQWMKRGGPPHPSNTPARAGRRPLRQRVTKHLVHRINGPVLAMNWVVCPMKE